MNYWIKKLLPGVLTIITLNVNASCGSSFCAIYNHWDTQGLNNTTGLSIDARYSQATADKLRAGYKKITPESPSGSDEEIEDKRTVMKLLTLDFDYAFPDSPWNIGIILPLIERNHTHTLDSSVVGPFEQQGKFTELGDIRVIGKYRLSNNLYSGNSLRVGIKLPSGATDKTMTPVAPHAEHTEGEEEEHEEHAEEEITGHHGNELERSTQPGSGSTDLILGYYHFGQTPGNNWGWFVSAQMQKALQTKDDYRPGTQTNLDLGASYSITSQISGLFQINLQHQQRDSGANANLASGGYSINLSPGLSYKLTDATRIYGFVQIAARQYTKTDPETGAGQLTAPWSFSLGVNHSF